MYYEVASSQLLAAQIAPRTKVVLESRQFSASSSTDTPRTKVVLQSRQFSSSSSPDTPRTKVVLQSRQFSASSSPDAVPATKSAHGGSQSAVPATKSAHGGSQSAQSAAPATKSAHGGSQSAAPATKSSLQETSENSNPNGRTIPRMTRDRLATVVPQTLTCQLRSHRFH